MDNSNSIEIEEPRQALIAVGFNEDHKVIQNELVRRIVSLLQQESKVTAQSAAEDWSGNFEENIRLTVGEKIRVSVTVTTNK